MGTGKLIKTIATTGKLRRARGKEHNHQWFPARPEGDDLNGLPMQHWKQHQNDSLIHVNGSMEITREEHPGPSYWKKILTREEYRALRLGEMELEFSHPYALGHFPKSGYYACRGCGNPLYFHDAKFDDGTGWAAFGMCVERSLTAKIPDKSKRGNVPHLDICCSECGSFIGCLYKETNPSARANKWFSERHCVSGLSLKYVDGRFPYETNEVTMLRQD